MKNLLIHNLLTVLSLSAAVFSAAATAPSLNFKHYGTEDGLPHPAVLDITQDAIGRIWFATEEGVGYYDGNRITGYKSFSGKDSTSIYAGDRMKRICATSGGVFVQTDKALVRYDIRLEQFSDVTDHPVGGIFSRGDSLWYADGNRLCRLNDRTGDIITIAELPFTNVTAMMLDRNNRFYFATYSGLYLFAGGQFRCLSPLPMVESLFEGSDGTIWAGTKNDGLIRLAPDGGMTVYNASNAAGKGLRENDIRKITEDGEGNLWIGSFFGLYRYDPAADRFDCFRQSDRVGDLSNSSVHSVFIDRHNTLWAGTYYGGANSTVLGDNSFAFFGASENPKYLSSPIVGDMTEDKRGDIWLCTEGGGLNRLNRADGTITRFKADGAGNFLPGKNLKTIVYDPKEDVLFIGTTADGLYRYDIAKGKFTRLRTGTVNSMAREGDWLFLSTNTNLVAHSIATGEERELFKYTSEGYNAVTIDSDKKLWLAHGADLIVYGAQSLKKLRTYSMVALGITNKITSVYESSDHQFYVSTHGRGLFRLNPGTGEFTPFPAEQSPMLSNYCYRIAETSDGHLVTTGNKGITIFDKDGTLAKTLTPGGSNPLRALTRDCGVFIASDGTVFAGSTNGLASFSEKGLLATDDGGGISFTELYVNGRRVVAGGDDGILKEAIPFTGEITLNHDQNRFNLFFAPDAPQSVLNPTVYEYRLDGLDESWYQTQDRNMSYTNLSPGTYTLRIRPRSYSDGAADNAPCASLKITVRHPWYATWWAILLWVCIFGVVAFFIIRYAVMRRRFETSLLREQLEKNKIREVNEAKFRFFTNVSHEFRTPLTLIIGQLDLLMQNSALPPLLYSKLAKVVRQTRHLNSLVTELIEFRKYEQNRGVLRVAEHRLNAYLNSEFDSFRELAVLQEIDYTFSPCPDDLSVWFDGGQMRKVLYNLLSNAFKYTAKGGKICLSAAADMEKMEVYIRIMDNGVGMDAKDLEHIFERFYQAGNSMPQSNFNIGSGIGLALTKSIVEAHKGSIRATSQLGYGAIFTITLPLGCEHLRGEEYVVFDKEQQPANDAKVIFTPTESSVEVALSDRSDKSDSSGSSDKPSVLLVEDNADLLRILVDIFAPFYNVATAADGGQAYEIVCRTKPDLVVSDIMMPVMTGTELCVKIKNSIDLCHIPVVLLTALNMPEQTIEGLTRGADDYISKPFNANILIARCNNIIRARRLMYQQLSRTAEPDLALAATNSLDKKFLDTITAFIEENISDTELSVAMIADKMCMGRTSFYNKFKALTGMSPNDFVNSFRLKRATSLLRNHPEMSVSEIADNLGFNTSSYFCRKFKDEYGVSPTQFRQKKPAEDMV